MGDSNSFIAKEENLATFEVWASQFEASEQSGVDDEFTLSPTDIRKRIWIAEQSQDMSLETFFQRIAQN